MVRRAMFRGGLLLLAILLGRCPTPRAIDAYPLADVRPGLRGTVLTVFAGMEPDSFPVEVVGVLHGSSVEGHTILVRALGERLEEIGVAAGMSGSPVYVDGRLLGALAFAFRDAKQPIGGVTPFEEMVATLQPALAGQDRATGTTAGPMAGERLSAPELPPFHEWRALCADPAALTDFYARMLPSANAPAGLRRLDLPLIVNGGTGSGAETLSALWSPLGLHALPGGGRRATAGQAAGESEGAAAGAFHPGDAMGVNLVSGDMNVSAIGTVTWVDEGRILAFGHPLLYGGAVELPVSRARIETIIPSRDVSFKLGTALEPIGTLIADHRPGVAAITGQVARTIPLLVKVHTPESEAAREYRFEIARHELLAPSMMALATSSAATARSFGVRVGTVASHLQITLDDGRVIERRDLFRSLSVERVVAQSVMAPVAYLAISPYAPFPVAAVAVEIELDAELQAANVDRVIVPRQRVRPGERIEVEVRLQRHLGGEERQQVTLEVPEWVQGERLQVMAGSATAFTEWDQERAPEKYRPRNHDDLVRLIGEYPSEESLIVRLYGVSRGVVLRGRELSSLPGSRRRALSGGTTGGEISHVEGVILDEVVVPTGQVILGGTLVELTIAR